MSGYSINGSRNSAVIIPMRYRRFIVACIDDVLHMPEILILDDCFVRDTFADSSWLMLLYSISIHSADLAVAVELFVLIAYCKKRSKGLYACLTF